MCNVCALKINEIFPLEIIKELLKPDSDFMMFVEEMQIEGEMNEYGFVPVADDGLGGFFVFASNQKDNAIYYIDHEKKFNIKKCAKFVDFEEFLEEQDKLMDYLNEED